MSNTNDGPKTYYGPWLEELPEELPDGALWQREWLNPLTKRKETEMFASVNLRILGMAWRNGHSRIRRVWPPGSVVPEPRPFVVDGKVQSMEQSEWWMISSTRTGGAYWHMMDRGYNEWLSQKPELQEGALYYPVQRMTGDAMVAIPWQDQIGEVGE